jgi:hypothetical protein
MRHDGEEGAPLRPGDYAMISRCDNKAHLGRLVRVISPHEDESFDWDVELLGMPIRGYGTNSRKVGHFRYAAVYQWNLTRLEGLEHSDREVSAAGHPSPESYARHPS